jgi:Uma2 family endonuclease
VNQTPVEHHYTQEEYLELEESGDTKFEFFDGEVFAMAGGTPDHSLIAANLIRQFGNALAPQGCYVFTSDLRLKVEASGLCTHSDVTVLCGPGRYEGRLLLNPTLIVEVLSKSTEGYDRGGKFDHYRTIKSLQTVEVMGSGPERAQNYSFEKNDPVCDSFLKIANGCLRSICSKS